MNDDPIRVGRGPRAVEDLLAAEVLAACGADADLVQPVRVVVPSRSLAHHVQAALVRRTGRPLLGVVVRTLGALALDVLDRAGEAAPTGYAWLPLLVRRAAREEPALRVHLDALVDGYAVVDGAVRDLLDAGLDAANASGIEEAAHAEASDPELAERAAAVVRVARVVAERLEQGAAASQGALLRRAAECIARDPEGALPARAILLTGFADATGVQLDLLEALLRRDDARLLVDLPPEPRASGTPERTEDAFPEQLRLRLLKGAAWPEPDATTEPSTLVSVRSPTPEVEAREVAHRVRAELDAGVPPERIGIVARHFDAHRLGLRRHLTRLAIPFSGVAEHAPPGAAGRRLRDLTTLLRERERTPAERWLSLLVRPGIGPVVRADVALALHVLGCARLAEVAALELPRDFLELPVRRGLVEDASGGVHASNRKLETAVLAEARAAARAVCERLRAWPDPAPPRVHLASLHALGEIDLGWRGDAPGAAQLRAALELGVDAPDEPVDWEEFLLLFEQQLAGAADPPIGGAGGGVQLLNVMEARARSFDSLYVLGLTRGVFPRVVREDALLPDALRRRLRATLPELPVKSEGHDEERYLFAQLLAAAPRVTLCSAEAADDDSLQSPSPLVERLRIGTALQQRSARSPLAASAEADAPRTAAEVAIFAGLHGTRRELHACLPDALEAAWSRAGIALAPDRSRAIAAARVAVLTEIDSYARPGLDPGPYLGFAGRVRGDAADPRRRPLFATAAETLVGCPWQGFLERMLRLDRLPDSLAHLPEASPLRVGRVVHEVLEQIVREAAPGALPETLGEALASSGFAVPWPDPDALERLLHRAADAVVRAEGVGLPRFAEVLAAHARPYVERARDVAWPASEVLGVEVEGALEPIAAGGRAFHFRADRVERTPDGVRLTDYKTGKPKVAGLKSATRDEQLQKCVTDGALLQGVAYARAALTAGAPVATGVYLHLKPDLDPRVVSLEARGDAEDLAGEFAEVRRDLDLALDEGAFFPRLTDPVSREGPRRCGYCAVKIACARGDTGLRQRQERWVADTGGRELTGGLAAMRTLWPRGASRS